MYDSNKRFFKAQLFFSAFLIFVCFPPFVNAADDFLNPVVVSGSRFEQPLADVLASVTVISKEEIQKSQAPSITELLQGEPGFEFGRNGGPGAMSSIFLRGENSISSAIYVDGVRVSTDGYGTIPVNALPAPASIDHIEIMRGNSGALHGEAAIGGVINIYTRANNDGPPKAYGTATVGSNSTYQAVAGIGGRNNDTKFDLNFNGQTSNGFAPINNTYYPYQYVNPNTGNSSGQGLSAVISQMLHPNLEIGISERYQVSNFNYADASAGPCNLGTWGCQGPGNGSGPQSIFSMRTTTQDTSVFAKFNISSSWKSRIDYANSQINYDYTTNENTVNVPGLANISNYGTKSITDSVRWDNTFRINPNNTFVFGADYATQKYNDGFGDSMTRDSFAYFVGYNLKWQKFDFQLNGRHDQLTVNEDGSGLPKTSYSANTGLIGAGYWVSDNFKLLASLSSGFRAPSVGETFGYTQAYGANLYNPNLKPETHVSTEFGAEFNNSYSKTRLVHFDTSTTNAISGQSVFDGNGNYLGYESYNIGQVKNQGWEFSERAKWRGYTIVGAFTWQNPLDTSTGQTLARRAQQFGSLMVNKSFGENNKYDLGTKVIYSGARSDAYYDPNSYAMTSVNLGAYKIWGFHAGMKLNDEWTVRAKLDNAFNENYQLVYGYNTPGRTAWLTLIYQQK